MLYVKFSVELPEILRRGIGIGVKGVAESDAILVA